MAHFIHMYVCIARHSMCVYAPSITHIIYIYMYVYIYIYIYMYIYIFHLHTCVYNIGLPEFVSIVA